MIVIDNNYLVVAERNSCDGYYEIQLIQIKRMNYFVYNKLVNIS